MISIISEPWVQKKTHFCPFPVSPCYNRNKERGCAVFKRRSEIWGAVSRYCLLSFHGRLRVSLHCPSSSTAGICWRSSGVFSPTKGNRVWGYWMLGPLAHVLLHVESTFLCLDPRELWKIFFLHPLQPPGRWGVWWLGCCSVWVTRS